MIGPVNFEEALAVYELFVNDILDGEDVVLTGLMLLARVPCRHGSGRSHQRGRGR